jgi:hypothetical protein
MQVHFTV